MQAVVLADSFASNFRPVTFQQPKVLMPLVNVPMLEYTCEFLAAGGMHEIFIESSEGAAEGDGDGASNASQISDSCWRG